RPVAITDAIVVEEGFRVSDLERIMKSMDSTASEAGVAIIGGDVKVMPRGKLDKIVVATCGVGIARRGSIIMDSGARPGDKVIITGSIGDHGVALLSKRMGLAFETELRSDVAPIWKVTEAVLDVGGVTAMKDPTRGGIASALNEIASKSRVSVWLDEEKIPIKDSARAACEMLGLDPFEITCEGKAVICVRPEKAEAALEAIKRAMYGSEAAIVGTTKAERPGYVFLETVVGGTRIIEKPIGEPIPRVC
ncbi:MAG: hydrogenase expression/formation protein HypE, partial [Candidatus Bathyarchaeia archaeon]